MKPGESDFKASPRTGERGELKDAARLHAGRESGGHMYLRPPT